MLLVEYIWIFDEVEHSLGANLAQSPGPEVLSPELPGAQPQEKFPSLTNFLVR